MITPNERKVLLPLLENYSITIEDILQLFIEARATSQYKLPPNHIERVNKLASTLKVEDMEIGKIFRLGYK